MDKGISKDEKLLKTALLLFVAVGMPADAGCRTCCMRWRGACNRKEKKVPEMQLILYIEEFECGAFRGVSCF